MRRSRAFTFLLVAPLFLPGTVWGQSGLALSAELGFRTKYLFAGIPFAAEQVTHATVTGAAAGFTVNGYAVFDHDAGEVTEADVYGDYYAQLTDVVGVYVGAAYYSFKFPDSWEGTPELYGGIVLATPLTPTIHVAHDLDLGDGTYIVLGLSHAVPLGSGGITLDLAGHAAYNGEYYTSESGLAFADIGAALGIPVGPVTLAPMVLVQRRLDDAFDLFIPNEEVFGITASWTLPGGE